MKKNCRNISERRVDRNAVIPTIRDFDIEDAKQIALDTFIAEGLPASLEYSVETGFPKIVISWDDNSAIAITLDFTREGYTIDTQNIYSGLQNLYFKGVTLDEFIEDVEAAAKDVVIWSKSEAKAIDYGFNESRKDHKGIKESSLNIMGAEVPVGRFTPTNAEISKDPSKRMLKRFKGVGPLAGFSSMAGIANEFGGEPLEYFFTKICKLSRKDAREYTEYDEELDGDLGYAVDDTSFNHLRDFLFDKGLIQPIVG